MEETPTGGYWVAGRSADLLADALTEATLVSAGVAPDLVDSARLILSELYSNTVHACGEFAPLVAEVGSTHAGVGVVRVPVPGKEIGLHRHVLDLSLPQAELSSSIDELAETLARSLP
ncbi:hypothetical protein [Streptomyces sp. NPDC057557]|uniref:hypothetical protein n=1 Tax=Streptomyces sp. NPDC057557 TaxID=3346167 RepID=UPI00368FF264